MDRGIIFYEKLFGYKSSRDKMDSFNMVWFPQIKNGSGFAGSYVFHDELFKPSADRIMICFTSPAGNLINELNRNESAGGKVLIPRTLINEDIGYITVFLDTECNRIVLRTSE